MSTHNDALYISKCIESVLNQTLTNFEYLIINDKSTDDTQDIVTQYKKRDNRIRLYNNGNNLGVTASLNKLLVRAKGDFIARIDGDDYWTDRNKLKIQVDFLKKNNHYSLVGTWAKVISEHGDYLFSLEYPVKDSVIRSRLLRENCFITSSVMIRGIDMRRAGNFNITNRTAQDYDMWLMLGRRRLLANIPKFMVNYRQNPKGISQTKYSQQIADTVRIIKQNKNHYPGYTSAMILWNIRRYYPSWLRGKLSFKFKKVFI